ncbi:hypothetical protein KI387_025733, partial [Taxus chinensis]
TCWALLPWSSAQACTSDEADLGGCLKVVYGASMEVFRSTESTEKIKKTFFISSSAIFDRVCPGYVLCTSGAYLERTSTTWYVPDRVHRGQGHTGWSNAGDVIPIKPVLLKGASSMPWLLPTTAN